MCCLYANTVQGRATVTIRHLRRVIGCQLERVSGIDAMVSRPTDQMGPS